MEPGLGINRIDEDVRINKLFTHRQVSDAAFHHIAHSDGMWVRFSGVFFDVAIDEYTDPTPPVFYPAISATLF